jgi:hypothetical protein
MSDNTGMLLGLAVGGVGLWWLGSQMGWWGGAAPATPTPSVPTAPGIVPAPTAASPSAPAVPAPVVTLAGVVTMTVNNALKADVSINGTVQNIAIIPGGAAYNPQGQDITAKLTAAGVDVGKLYAMMQAAYPQAGPPPTTGTASASSALAALQAAYKAISAQIPGAQGAQLAAVLSQQTVLAGQIKALGGTPGMGAYMRTTPRTMVHASRKNYVRRLA